MTCERILRPVMEPLSPPGEERVVVLVKPGGIKAGLARIIASHYMSTMKLRLLYGRLLKPSRDELERFLDWRRGCVRATGFRLVGKNPHRLGEIERAFGTAEPLGVAWQIREKNITHMSDVLIAMVFSGQQALLKGKAIKKAIRTVYAHGMTRDEAYIAGKCDDNKLHCSTTPEEAEHDERWLATIPEYENSEEPSSTPRGSFAIAS